MLLLEQLSTQHSLVHLLGHSSSRLLAVQPGERKHNLYDSIMRIYMYIYKQPSYFKTGAISTLNSPFVSLPVPFSSNPYDYNNTAEFSVVCSLHRVVVCTHIRLFPTVCRHAVW